MKLAFPYMGSINITLSAILRRLGVSPVIPPPPNRATLMQGARHAPEAMCVPFKLTLGNMMQALEAGADTLAYVSGSWSCRFGYYGRLQARILRDMGYAFRLIELRHDNLTDIAREIVMLSNQSWARAVTNTGRALRTGWLKSSAVDDAESLGRATLPFVKNKEDVRRALKATLRSIDRTEGSAELRRLRRGLPARFSRLERNGRRHALRVKLVGESFCTIEPFINFDVVDRLGAMGCHVDPFLTAHRWLGFHGFRIGRSETALIEQSTAANWAYCVGGEDRNSLGHLIAANTAGYDGVVHVHPFGCMPSTVVQPTMTRMSEELDLPYIALSVDEHTSETGFATRLEGFVELLLRKQRGRSRASAESAEGTQDTTLDRP